ncbi:NAD(+) synthase [Porphyromonas canoris]|uniref:Glutamine-dependent NAD(+) synthetase n=1 Tax=Porphyromonas canoris TaxID=36875 RepID=A0ABR4XKH3_9PORP|nr:NAD(+) synthase [Porphyromonas canoris]KGN92183.1 NAD synthetase [Porphyromonas canoris]
MKHGYVKVAAGVPFVKVADCNYNIERIEKLIFKACEKGVEIITFPELCITGYTCSDLFIQPFLQRQAEEALCTLVERTKETDILVFVGMPIRVEQRLYNAAIAFQNGKILGAIPKTFLPNYREFQERRWFSSANELSLSHINIKDFVVPIGHNLLFKYKQIGIGVEICEDMWTATPPGTRLSLYGAHIIFNLSASNENAGKHAYLRALISGNSAQAICGYVYASCGYGESSTDLVYTGKAFIAENGEILSEMERFEYGERLLINDIDVEYIRTERLINTSFKSVASVVCTEEMTEIPFYLNEVKEYDMTRPVEKYPFMPSSKNWKERCQEMWDIQMSALFQRLIHIGTKKAVIGISGGLDSTLTLMVAVHAFDFMGWDRKGIIGVTMPGFGTSERTYNNAKTMMNGLGISTREVEITESVRNHLAAIGHDGKSYDVTFENAQARERAQILMDIANMEGAIVLGTGDLSELALGWTTFAGDHMSMYNVNASIPKTVVRLMVEHIADNGGYAKVVEDALRDVLKTPVSPELLPEKDKDGTNRQSTEAIIGPYELHDFFLYHMIHNAFSPTKILFMAGKAFGDKYSKDMLKRTMTTFIRRFFSNQFKRNCSPDAPKVGAITLSPRGGWRMPSDAVGEMWIREIEKF